MIPLALLASFSRGLVCRVSYLLTYKRTLPVRRVSCFGRERGSAEIVSRAAAPRGIGGCVAHTRVHVGRRRRQCMLLAAFSPLAFQVAAAPRHAFGHTGVALCRAGIATMGRKPGVSSPEELATFCTEAGEKIIVVDVRNP